MGGYEGRHRGASDQALDNAWSDDANYPALFTGFVDPTASLPRLRLTPVDASFDGPVDGDDGQLDLSR